MQLNEATARQYVADTFKGSYCTQGAYDVVIEDGMTIYRVECCTGPYVSVAEVWRQPDGSLYGEL
jgi:hypothetical protein